MNDNYEDIINLPHHVSKTHPRMLLVKRAAQFGSFKALSGFEKAIDETFFRVSSRYDESGEQT